MNEHEPDSPEKREDFNIYAAPRNTGPPAAEDWRRNLRRRRTKWMWLGMLPSLVLPLMILSPGILGWLLLAGALAWIGHCVSRIAVITASLAGNFGEPTGAGCLFFGLLCMNITVSFGLLFAGCVFFGAFLRRY